MSALTGTPKRDRTGSCGCGCTSGSTPGGGPAPDPAHDTACGLAGPVRPRFFCGQLLTDEDLTALVGWTSARLALQRFRDGWGVVCGLDVRCDPAHPLGVLVGPGYAVTCCGEDVVVCANASLDLSGAAAGDDPCADPDAVIVAAPPITGSPAGAVAAMRARLAGPAGGSTADPVEARTVDIVVRYAERAADPRASLRHTECVQAPECEPARIAESFELRWVGAGDDPDAAATAAWCAGYTACLDVLRRFSAEVGGESTDQARRKWLRHWIDDHAPHVFGGLREQVCSWSDEELRARTGEVLTALVLECRRAYVRSGCPSCRRADGVRLARVRIGQVSAGKPVRVLSVDADPPYRRPHGPGSAALQGGTDVASLVGMRWEQAQRRLEQLGVPAVVRTIDTALSAADLAGLLECGCAPVVAPDTTALVDVAVLDGEERVVGFCAAAEAGPVPAVPTPADPVPTDPVPAVPPTDEELRNREVTRLTGLPTVGRVVAERLHDAGFTVDGIAAVADADRAQLENDVRRLLLPQHRDKAAAVVDAARRIHAGGSA